MLFRPGAKQVAGGMVRLSKFADYGLVLMACIAERQQEFPLRTARDLSEQSKLPLPTVSRLLKMLMQGGLLVSRRGIQGGYSLAREAEDISLLEVIAALEGPVALTECSTDISGLCDLETCCSIKNNQRLINKAVRGALANISVQDLIHPMKLTTIQDANGKKLPTITIAPGRN